MPLATAAPIFAAMAIQIRTSLAEPDTGETFVPHRPQRPDKAEGGRPFELVSDYQPAGDQPTAIAELVEGIADKARRARCCSASPDRARPSPWPR